MRPAILIACSALLCVDSAASLATPGFLVPAVQKFDFATGQWSSFTVGDPATQTSGVNISVGSLGNGSDALVTSSISPVVGTDAPTVTIFDTSFQQIGPTLSNFLPVSDAHRQSVRTDLQNGELIVGGGPGGGPHVQFFNYSPATNSFGTVGRPPYEPFNSYLGGVHVAIGDVDGDGSTESVVAAKKSYGGHVSLIKRGVDSTERLIDFNAYNPNVAPQSDISVEMGDLNGDGRDEILTFATDDVTNFKTLKAFSIVDTAGVGLVPVEVLSYSARQMGTVASAAGKASFSDLSPLGGPRVLLSANNGDGPVVSFVDISYNALTGYSFVETPVDLTALRTGDLADNWSNVGFTVGYSAQTFASPLPAGSGVAGALPTSGTLFLGPSIIPEPASLGVLMLAIAPLTRRRR